MGQHEAGPLAGLGYEGRHGGHASAVQLDVTLEHDLIRAGDRQDPAPVVQPGHPRDSRSVFEAER